MTSEKSGKKGDTVETGRAEGRRQMGASLSQTQRSGGTQGAQEQMYEDRLKGLQGNVFGS